MKKIFIESYGCSANSVDSEIMSGLLRKGGFSIINSPKESDLNIINTCVVKTPTENRMIHRIKELTKLNKSLIVAGCMPKVEKNVIEEINPTASMLGPNSIEKIVDVAAATLQTQKIVFLENLRKPKVCIPKVRKNSVINITPISTGCLSNCSYCIVKFARGRLFSYPVNMIVNEAKQATNNGCKELWITSQDNSCYGKDTNTPLPQLLDEICKIEGKFLIRIGMMNPLHTKEVVDDLIHVYQNEKIFKFLHLPVQSGSNRILKSMNRGYKVKDFIDIAKKFRKATQNLTLATDIIVGFPNETKGDFEKTVELIEKVKPDVVNISKFGARPGTEAAKMEQLNSKVVNERSSILHSLIRKISLENNKKWLGWTGEILIDEISENFAIGRNFAYKPIIIKKNLSLGKFFDVRIEKIASNFLVGKLQ